MALAIAPEQVDSCLEELQAVEQADRIIAARGPGFAGIDTGRSPESADDADNIPTFRIDYR